MEPKFEGLQTKVKWNELKSNLNVFMFADCAYSDCDERRC